MPWRERSSGSPVTQNTTPKQPSCNTRHQKTPTTTTSTKEPKGAAPSRKKTYHRGGSYWPSSCDKKALMEGPTSTWSGRPSSTNSHKPREESRPPAPTTPGASRKPSTNGRTWHEAKATGLPSAEEHYRPSHRPPPRDARPANPSSGAQRTRRRANTSKRTNGSSPSRRQAKGNPTRSKDPEAMQQDQEHPNSQPNEYHNKEPRYSTHLEDQSLQASPPKRHDTMRQCCKPCRTTRNHPLNNSNCQTSKPTQQPDPAEQPASKRPTDSSCLSRPAPYPRTGNPTHRRAPCLGHPLVVRASATPEPPPTDTASSHCLTDAHRPMTSSPKR